MSLSLEKRKQHFLDRVHKTDTCWVWIGVRDSKGYGKVRNHYKYFRAHRLSYLMFVGPIPEGLELDHLCRNKLCVNPAHLEPVTHKENVLRGQAPSAVNARKTHCPKGHSLSGDNLLIENNRTTKTRRCRTCRMKSQVERTRKYRAKQRQT